MKIKTLPIREIVFGLEDGIVSTLGVLVGIAVGTNNRSFIILSGLVVIFVESLSMAAGTYLSSKSQAEIQQTGFVNSILKYLFRKRTNLPLKESGYMGVSYLLGGLVSLTSFFLLPVNSAVISAILFSFLFLFTLGFIKGKLAKTNPVKSGLEMMTVSALASLVGFVIGKLASNVLVNIP